MLLALERPIQLDEIGPVLHREAGQWSHVEYLDGGFDQAQMLSPWGAASNFVDYSDLLTKLVLKRQEEYDPS